MSYVLRFFGWSSLCLGFLAGLIQGVITGNLFSFWGILNFLLNVFGGAAAAAIFFTLSYLLNYVESIHQLVSELSKKEQPKMAYPEKGRASAPSFFSETSKPQ